MSSLVLAASVVTPLLIYMVIGLLIRKLKIFSADQFRGVNKLVFKIFLPIKLFMDVYQTELHDILDPKLFGYTIIAILVIIAIVFTIISFTVKEKQNQSTMIQGIFRSNFVLFGSMIAAEMGGDSAKGLAAALAAVVVPLFNMLAVILFELKRGGKVKVGSILLNIIKNPLIDASVLGLLMNILHVNVPVLAIPDLILTPFTKLGNMSTPLALVALGGMLSFASIKSHTKLLIAATMGRLILVPAVALALAIILGFRNDALVVLIAVFASPTAVSSAPMAQMMGGNGDLANEIVAITSVGCILTIFLFVFTLSSLHLI